MKSQESDINLPLSFKQVIDLVKQLPYNEKMKLSALLSQEAKNIKEKDLTLTHYASEKTLSEDWLLQEEDEAWKNL